MSHRAIRLSQVVAVILPLVVAAGCASEQQRAARAQMERARTAYQLAQTDPTVQTYAPLRLIDAEKALRAAEGAKDVDDRLHLGYIAEKKAEIATVTGATSKTEQSMQQLGKEVSATLLQKRDRELKAARAGTQTSGPDAEQARRAAETRAREAEAQAREAEARARETEQARRQAAVTEQARAAEEAKAAALAKELANLKAQQTGRGLVLTVGDVLFAPGKAEVSSGAQRSIDKLADFLKAYPKRNVLIEGHTDNTGDEGFNIKLSQQRADTVRDQLVEKGVATQRIRTKGYGAKFPVVDNDTPGGRQQNRRVEVVVLEEGATAEGSSR
jgi:outer membrane protein OmpA-like peptidoglycan-associated protein